MAAGHGLSQQEQAIMDLWDAGRSFDQIAAAIGLKRDAVSKIVSTFDINGPADRDREAAIRNGSTRYAAALAATGKAFA